MNTIESSSTGSAWLPVKRILDRGRVAEQIRDELRDRILDGVLTRGTKLPTERELAIAYGVSGATIREALRALVSTHMIEVRHGSGAYVTADAEQLIAQSLHSMIQLEKIELPDTFGVLTVLNVYGAELAAARATPNDINKLKESLRQIEAATTPGELSLALKSFLFNLAEASHHHLLVAICKFLAGFQAGLTNKISSAPHSAWKRIRASLRDDRQRLVDAIARGDATDARTCALVFHQHAMQELRDTEAIAP